VGELAEDDELLVRARERLAAKLTPELRCWLEALLADDDVEEGASS
jgi:hypothetical protein